MRCVSTAPPRLAPIFRSDMQLQILAGAHEAVRVYAEAVISSPSTREFQRMRRHRNKSEYDDIAIGRADLTADVAHAEAIIQAVRHDL